jgi:hypothetical protein
MSEQTRNLPTEIFITGTWNANTNITSYNIALESGVGNPDEKYRVTDAGATNLDGISAWAVNDIAYFDYTTRTWQKIDNQTNSGVTGSGTLNYVPLWTPSGTQLGNSIITQSAGGNAIQIGTTFLVDNAAKQVGINKLSSLAAALHIVGNGNTSGTSSFIVQNNTPTTLFQIKDDGQVSSTYGYWQGANKILYINPNGIIQSVFVGESSGNGTVTGSQNTGVGSQTLISVTSGTQNTAVGWASLILNTSGYVNTAVGTGALYANSSGWGNTGVGTESLRFNTIGFENAAIGYKSSYSVTTGVGNTTIGAQSLYLTTTASYNVAIGYQAGYYNTTASDQLYIHNGRGVTNYATGLTNSLIYGIFALTPDAQYYTVNANVKITQGLTETKITDVATGTHTVLSSEYIFNCTGDCTINLPATTATNVGIGKVYRIFAGEAVTVTITPDGADTIDGAASATVIGWGMVTLRVLSNGNWRVGD